MISALNIYLTTNECLNDHEYNILEKQNSTFVKDGAECITMSECKPVA